MNHVKNTNVLTPKVSTQNIILVLLFVLSGIFYFPRAYENGKELSKDTTYIEKQIEIMYAIAGQDYKLIQKERGCIR